MADDQPTGAETAVLKDPDLAGGSSEPPPEQPNPPSGGWYPGAAGDIARERGLDVDAPPQPDPSPSSNAVNDAHQAMPDCPSGASSCGADDTSPSPTSSPTTPSPVQKLKTAVKNAGATGVDMGGYALGQGAHVEQEERNKRLDNLLNLPKKLKEDWKKLKNKIDEKAKDPTGLDKATQDSTQGDEKEINK